MLEKQLHERMDALLGARSRAEMEAIKALTNEIKMRVESCDRLLHVLKLQVSDFIKDEDSLTYALEPKPPPLPAREELPPFCLSTAQLARMVAWLKSSGRRQSMPACMSQEPSRTSARGSTRACLMGGKPGLRQCPRCAAGALLASHAARRE